VAERRHEGHGAELGVVGIATQGVALQKRGVLEDGFQDTEAGEDTSRIWGELDAGTDLGEGP